MRRSLAWASAGGIVVLTSFALGVFLFDRALIVFKKVQPHKTTIFTNAADLGLLWKCALGAALLLGAAVLFLGFLRSRMTGRAPAESVLLQAETLLPLLALFFSRFVYGKYLKSLFDVPLYPLLTAAAVAAVLWLNASLHFGLRLGGGRERRAAEAAPGRRGRTQRALVLTAAALILVHLLGQSPFYRRFTSLMVFTGDEPKYLRMAYSLAGDGDLDLTNNFVGDDVEVDWLLQKSIASGKRAIGHFSIVGRDGGIYHFHMPGISFLMLPGFLLDLAFFQRDIPNTQALMFLPAKMVFIRLVFLMLAVGLFLLAARLFYRMFRSTAVAALLLLVLLFATKIPEFLFQVYPESAAIFFLLLGLNAVFFPFRRGGGNALALILAVGFLPWLHQRFLPLAAGLYGLFLLREIFERKNWKRALGVSLPLAAVGAGYLYYFYAITGSPLPWSLYSLWGTSYTRAAILPSGFFGYLFDTGSGLLSLTPAFFFTLTGIYWGIKLDRRRALMLLALALPYFVLISITPWHGLPWETTRMSLALYPVFLIFIGYTVRALKARTSWAHLAFYAAGLGFVVLNRAHRFWNISLGNVLILPHQVGYIIQCAFVLAGFILALWGLDLWTRKRLGALSFQRIEEVVKNARRGLRTLLSSRWLRKTLTASAVVLSAAYVPVFLANWDDKTMAISYFAALNKVAGSETAALHPKGHPSSARNKGDAKYLDIFKWEVPVELLPDPKKTVVRFGEGLFADACPPGCYKVDLELYDPPPELRLLALDFMGETREMRVTPGIGKIVVSTIYLVFQDVPVSPTFAVRHPGRIARPVKGRLNFFPIPSVIFDKRMMIRLSEDLYPDCVRTIGSSRYLTFVANSRKDNARFTFKLFRLPVSGGGEKEAPLLLAARPVRFRNRWRHKFEMKLDLIPEGPSDGGTLVFSAEDVSGRTLPGRSIWLEVRDGAWVIPMRPSALSRH